jgi:hypothetical protein
MQLVSQPFSTGLRLKVLAVMLDVANLSKHAEALRVRAGSGTPALKELVLRTPSGKPSEFGWT